MAGNYYNIGFINKGDFAMKEEDITRVTTRVPSQLYADTRVVFVASMIEEQKIILEYNTTAWLERELFR